MLHQAKFYLLHHPRVIGKNRINWSYFPDNHRLQSVLKNMHTDNSTPVFITDMKIVRERLREERSILRSLWKKSIVAYSFKTNYAAIPQLYRLGVFAEVTSERELLLAFQAGYSGKHIIFNGPYKTRKALILASKNNVLIQVDNVAELMMISELANKSKKPFRLGCRVNLVGHGLPSSHFGLYVSELFDHSILKVLHANNLIRFEGIHFHVGSDIEDVRVFERAATQVGRILNSLSNIGLQPKYVNCGGGVMSHGAKPHDNKIWKPYEFDQYARVLWNSMRKEYPSVSELTVIFESGRYLVDDATVFVAKALRTKKSTLEQLVFTDGTTAMYPLSQYRPQLLRIFSFDGIEKHGSLQPSVVYGASCRETDVLHRGWMPLIKPDDFLVFYCAGAYNQTLGSDFIFSKPQTYFLLD